VKQEPAVATQKKQKKTKKELAKKYVLNIFPPLCIFRHQSFPPPLSLQRFVAALFL